MRYDKKFVLISVRSSLTWQSLCYNKKILLLSWQNEVWCCKFVLQWEILSWVQQDKVCQSEVYVAMRNFVVILVVSSLSWWSLWYDKKFCRDLRRIKFSMVKFVLRWEILLLSWQNEVYHSKVCVTIINSSWS